jgi:hypothetical protein
MQNAKNNSILPKKAGLFNVAGKPEKRIKTV